MSEVCRGLGISVATFYKWRAKFGGVDAFLMARMKELKEENRRLKKVYAQEKIKADIVAEGARKKVVRPSRRRERAKRAVQGRGLSIRAASARRSG